MEIEPLGAQGAVPLIRTCPATVRCTRARRSRRAAPTQVWVLPGCADDSWNRDPSDMDAPFDVTHVRHTERAPRRAASYRLTLRYRRNRIEVALSMREAEGVVMVQESTPAIVEAALQSLLPTLAWRNP